MSQVPPVSPQLGRAPAVVLMLLAAAVIALLVGYRQALGIDTPVGSDTVQLPQIAGLFTIGVIYGVASGTGWMTSMVSQRYVRWLSQMAIVLATAYLLASLQHGRPIRFVASVGGVLLVQAVLFSMFRIPSWHMTGGSWRRADETLLETSPPSSSWQFGIGEILGFTTAAAVLLAIAIRYHHPSVAAPTYWFGSLLVSLAMGLMSARLVSVTLRRTGWGAHAIAALGLVLLATLTSIALVLLTGAWDVVKDADGLAPFAERIVPLVLLYEAIFAGYLSAVGTFALAGRLASPEAQVPCR